MSPDYQSNQRDKARRFRPYKAANKNNTKHYKIVKQKKMTKKKTRTNTKIKTINKEQIKTKVPQFSSVQFSSVQFNSVLPCAEQITGCARKTQV